MLRDEVLLILDKKLARTSVSQDMVEMAVDETEIAILNFCNLKDVPEGLLYTWANMARDLIGYESPAESGSEDNTAGSITSIKEGDTTVSYGGPATVRHAADLDGITLAYKSQLARYRRMVW